MSLPILGRVLRSDSPSFCWVYSDSPAPLGTYVYAEFSVIDRATGSRIARKVVGIVSNSSYSPIMERPVLADLREDIPHDYRVPSISTILVYVVADITDKRSEIPRYPIPPGTPIYPAPPEALRILYTSPREGFIRIGFLSEYRGIEIGVNVNELSRHFLIAGATGSGKSNTVAILADRLSQIGAPVIIFDVHGEYVGLEPEDRNSSRVVEHEATISPYKIPPKILASMIVREAAATKQRRLLRRALRRLNKAIEEKASKEGLGLSIAVERLYEEKKIQGLVDAADEEAALEVKDMYLALLLKEIESVARERDYEKRIVDSTVDKVEEFFETSPINLEAPRITDLVEPGKVIVINVSTLSDEEKSWILRLYADNLLAYLKEGGASFGSGALRMPVVFIVEEAPLFLPANASSPAKDSLQRFAREGRKFGGVLGIVSQRPRSLDPNVASQLQNFVFLKLVQEEDIRAVMNIADSLEESLAGILPSLPKGRAIVMGEWVGRFPVLVDIDEHRGKKRGATPDLYRIWSSGSRSRERVIEEKFKIDV